MRLASPSTRQTLRAPDAAWRHQKSARYFQTSLRKNQGANVAWPVFARLCPAKPRTARPIAIITQVEGSGIVAWKLSAEIEENSRAPPEVENGWSATIG